MSSNYEYRLKSYYTSDGQHFNGMGYRKIAKDVLELLINDFVRIQFDLLFRQKQ